MSSWAKKLETKLSALSENSSKESIQTLAKWIGFNRKHAATFAEVLSQRLVSESSRIVTLSVIHQVLLLDKNVSSKWDKLLELRVVLGETVLLPNAATLTSSLTQQYLKEWDTANVFGGPTLVNQLKRQLATTSGTKSPTPLSPKATTAKESTQADDKTTATNAATTKTPASLSNEKEKGSSATKEKTGDAAPSTTATTKEPSSTTTTTETASDKEKSTAKPEPPNEKSQNEQKTPPAAATTTTTSSTAASPSRRASVTTTTVYDLEAKGIPPAPVQMKQLQEPCRSVATLQIARDLRNDSAQQLSGILTELPEAVQALVTKVKTAKQDVEPLDDDKARDLSIQTNDTAIDLDVSDQLANIRMFREILEKQRQARTQLIQLLIQSRCHFGAQEAAQAFAQATRAKAELQARKQVLLDAMDLEGLELPAEDKTRTEAADQALVEAEQMTLAWYNSNATTSTAGDQEADAKKPRIAQDG